MAGLDGIKRKIDPTALGYGPFDKTSMNCLTQRRKKSRVPGSLDEALDALQADYEFLTEGGVFTQEFLENFIEFKRAEAKAVNIRVHPHEYSLYYDL